MKTRSASLVVATAAVLGGLTGAYVLPAGELGQAAGTPPTSIPDGVPSPGPADPSTGPIRTPTSPPTPTSTPTPTPTRTTKPTERDLLSEQSFADVGVAVSYYSAAGSTIPAAAVSTCVANEAHEGHRTMKELTGHDPAVEGSWTDEATGDTADESIAVGTDATDAAQAVRALVAAQADCQQAARGQWIYGPVHTLDTSASVSSSWIGYFSGEQNLTGAAPDDDQPCGGLLFARNGARYSIGHVYLCLGSDQLAGLAAAAAARLG